MYTHTPPFEILFIDNHLLAVNKPSGVLTQPTDKEVRSLEVELKTWLKNEYQKPGAVFLGVLHRLDKQVSGVVLFARTSKALVRLNESIKSKKFQKTYYALVEGRFEKEEGFFEDFIFHGEHQASICRSDHPEAKFARLSYKVLKYIDNSTLLQIELETGRYHQIRIQFASRGFPIISDAKYGGLKVFSEDRIALHHFQLKFFHPVRQIFLTVEAPLPSHFMIGGKMILFD
jgi:23S rRNA pseudouridine1911/1915/1917 synthase